MAGHAGDADHGRPRPRHALEGVDDVDGAQQVDLQDRLVGPLDGGDSGGVHDGGHPALTGGLRHELVDGPTIGHVGRDAPHRVSLVTQRACHTVELTARGVGERRAPAADPACDRPAHATRAGNDDHVTRRPGPLFHHGRPPPTPPASSA